MVGEFQDVFFILFFIISQLSVICMFAKALIELALCDWVMKVNKKGLFYFMHSCNSRVVV